MYVRRIDKEWIELRIGEAAVAAGLEPSAIRYYEAHDVVPAPHRTDAGYRDYDDAAVDLLRFVRRLRSLELPLDDVKEIVSLRTRGEPPCSQVREAMAREAAAIQKRIDDLLNLREELSRLREAAAEIDDDWPTSCVCHVLEEAI